MSARGSKVGSFILGCCLVACIGLSAGPTPTFSRAAGRTAPAGSQYCGQVNHDDSISLRAFSHRISCRYAIHFAHSCLRRTTLGGWHLWGQRGPQGTFKLTRNASTIWLEDAGGTAKCLLALEPRLTNHCGTVSFTRTPSSNGAFAIQAIHLDCNRARRVAGASRPRRFGPGGSRRRYRMEGFTCHGEDRVPPRGGLERVLYDCWRGSAQLWFSRS